MVKRAVLIGIDQYEDVAGIVSLEGCVNDVEALAGVLTSRYQFQPERITKLVDPTTTTRSSILENLRKLIEETEQGDVALVYYSGHGSQVPDENHDEADGWDETIVPSDSYRSPNGEVRDIVDDELHSYITALTERTDYTTFIFDSCHSGSIDRDVIRPTAVRALKREQRPVPRAIPRAARRPGEIQPFPNAERPPATPSASGLISQGSYVLIAGCRDDETSLEEPLDGKADGLLTRYLVNELEAQAGASLETIFDEAKGEVERAAEEEDKHQRPVLEGPAGLKRALPFSPAASREAADAGTSEAPPSPPADTSSAKVGAKPRIFEWDSKFAGQAAALVILVLIAAAVTIGCITASVLSGEDGSTRVATTIVVELMFVGLLVGAAGAYIALLDQRGRSHALEAAHAIALAQPGPGAAKPGERTIAAQAGIDQIKGIFEAIGKMPTARALIAIGGLILAGSIALGWHVLPQSSAGKAPTIVKQPAAVTAKPGDKASFRVDVEGSGLEYEWQSDGKKIAESPDAPTLVIQHVRKGEDGDLIGVVVSNDAGEATSEGAELTVAEPPMPGGGQGGG
jgi:hypothetical protein